MCDDCVKEVVKLWKKYKEGNPVIKDNMPFFTYAANDWGRIPDDLPELNQLEVIAIARVQTMGMIYKLRSRHTFRDLCLRGHMISYKVDKNELILQGSNDLPRLDFEEFVKLTFLGTKRELIKLKKRAAHIWACIHNIQFP